MIVDIHTHNKCPNGNHLSIINLSLEEAERIYSSKELGYFSCGIHPWVANECNEEKHSALEKFLSDNRFIAVGECGLDKNSQSSMELQTYVFTKQILLSEKMQKPLIIHCVGCFNELLELKKHFKPLQQWIIHGFRGKPQLAKQLIKAGCGISFGEHFNIESLKITPVECLFIETDESLVSIELLYQKVAKIKNCRITSLNAGTNLITPNTIKIGKLL